MGVILRYIVPDGSGQMDGRLAVLATDGVIRWIHTDHQGSTVAVTGGVGNVQGAYAYSPYGESNTTGGSLGANLSWFGYTGREFDAETGNYQYRARYYHPTLGRFLSTDPIGTKDDPNLYFYVGGDPVNNVDPTGADIVVLNGPIAFGEVADHQAMIIGSDERGWIYISRDGSAGLPWHGAPRWKALSYPASRDLDWVLQHIDHARYDLGYIAEATEEQDEKMISFALSDVRRDYDVVNCNCGDLVAGAISVGGVDPYFPQTANPRDTRNHMKKSFRWREVMTNDTRPSSRGVPADFSDYSMGESSTRSAVGSRLNSRIRIKKWDE